MIGAGKTLRAQRKDLRRRMIAKRRELAQRLAALPAVQKRKARQRRIWAALLLLILLCLSRCICDSVNPPPPRKGAQGAVVKVKSTMNPQPKRGAERPVKIAKRLRTPYKADDALEPPWVEAFRLQVAARSQRLAQCFVGTSKPGAIRWTASLTPETGAVFDHRIEPMPPAEDLTREQQTCLVEVLAKPGYQKLATTHVGALPETVSLVLEF